MIIRKKGEIQISALVIAIIIIFVLIIVISGVIKLDILGKTSILPSFTKEKPSTLVNKNIPEGWMYIGEERKIKISSIEHFENEHTLKLVEIEEASVTIHIFSDVIEIKMATGETKKVDTNGDGFYDLEVTLNEADSKISGANIELNYIFEKIRLDPLEVKEEISSRGQPNSEEEIFQQYESQNSKDSNEIIRKPTDFWKGYDEHLKKSENILPTKKETYSWAEELPWREKIDDNYDDLGASEYLPCGTDALWKAINILNGPVSLNEINEKRTGGIRRGFLSIFSKEAKLITWPSEIKKIPKEYGLKVEKISGKEATIENARKLSTKNSVVIIHSKSRLLVQHYEIYDTNDVKSAYLRPYSESWKTNLENADAPLLKEIKSLYVIKK